MQIILSKRPWLRCQKKALVLQKLAKQRSTIVPCFGRCFSRNRRCFSHTFGEAKQPSKEPPFRRRLGAAFRIQASMQKNVYAKICTSKEVCNTKYVLQFAFVFSYAHYYLDLHFTMASHRQYTNLINKRTKKKI